MLKRSLGIAAVAAMALAFNVSPAQAVVLPPPGGDYLVVTAYFDGSGNLVGQRWSGCGQPAGQWGIRTSKLEIHFPSCS